MKYIRGFLMAWGCFCRIPCPYRKWDDDDRYAMLSMFPLVGLFLGVLICIAWKLLVLLGAGYMLRGGLLTALYFWMTGYIHLDGFMDCSDALLSRRPMEEKQRILKDSHVGAFAVVSLVFMVLVFTAAMSQLTETFSLPEAAVMCVIFMVSREMAAYDVINRKPMAESQYRNLSSHSANEKGLAGIVAVSAAAVVLFVFAFVSSAGQLTVLELFLYIWVVLVQAAVCNVTGRKLRSELGGMSGDVSGYMTVTGELTGVVLIALTSGI